MLHVVPELVRNDIRLREIAGRAESLRQLVEESQVEIDFAIPRAVERTGRGLRRAARRLDRVAEEHDAGGLVPRAQRLSPHTLHVAGDSIHEVDHPLFLRRRLELALGADGLRWRGYLLEVGQEIGAGRPA